MLKNTREVFISYAWGGNSEEFVNRLDQALQEKGITIIRDKRDLGYKGLIKEFMERIGKGKCVIAVISDKYLRSPNCMFELVQVSKNGEFYNRIFPILLPDVNIYDPIQRLKYIKYWEDKKKELNEAIKEVSAEYLQGIREEIDQYAVIRNTIAELTNILKDMNTLSPDIHNQSEFDDLFKVIECRLLEPSVSTSIHQIHSQEISNELAIKKVQQEKLGQGINQLVDDLQDTISPQLKDALSWLSNYKERASSIGKSTLKKYPEIQGEIIGDLRKSKRFYKELENCLYRLHFAIFTNSFLPLNEAKVTFDAKIYKSALDMVEERTPTNDDDVKQKMHEYIEYFKERLDFTI